MRRRIAPEAQEQIALMDWLKLQYPEIEKATFHIPNERKCSPQQGLLLKKMGVKSGVSDLFIAVSRGDYHGLFIEMKSMKGIKKKSQIEFIKLMNNNGYYAAFCFGWTEAMNLIHWYLSLVKK